jgi:hypothetical protein
MAGTAKEPRFAVRVEERWLSDDLEHASDAGNAALGPAIEELQSEGVAADSLRPCEDDGRDGTQLGGCTKLYIPEPAGQWGAVFTIDREASKVALVVLAVGERHPSAPGRPSVYEVADRRLHSSG